MRCKPIYEFLVWDNCNNNCQFCHQRKNPRLFNNAERKIILDEVLLFIDSDKFIKGSHILVCGGEIFDKPSDFEILDSFFKAIIKKMNDNIIDLLYINTNLIYEDTTGLYNFLKLIDENQLFNRLKFTTSYDLVGRFNDACMPITKKYPHTIMTENLKNLKSFYPDCNIVTNMVLTNYLCNKIIEEEFSIKEFMTYFKCWVNIIPYIILDEGLAPTRTQIFKALKKVDLESPGYLAMYIPNMSIQQDKWLYIYKDNTFNFCSCELSECGHSINFKRYSNRGTCFCCDLKEILNG